MPSLTTVSAVFFLLFATVHSSTEISASCQNFNTDLKKTSCKQRYFLFILPMISNKDWGSEAQRHLNFTRQILTPCYALEPQPPVYRDPGNSLVAFPSANFISTPIAKTFDHIMKQKKLNDDGPWEYQVIDRDHTRLADIAKLFDDVIYQMQRVDSYQGAIIMLHSGDPGYWTRIVDPQNATDYLHSWAKQFQRNEILGKLIFTKDLVLENWIINGLNWLRNETKGWFDWVYFERF
ncbi:unnamed protein product, partial [Mesorhabditis belari]|uniref:Uncharacterized protein n=1 Tax=Mesorhabditis belari TaxID=2138241 RepID=A0AAF3JB96_9BILA